MKHIISYQQNEFTLNVKSFLDYCKKYKGNSLQSWGYILVYRVTITNVNWKYQNLYGDSDIDWLHKESLMEAKLLFHYSLLNNFRNLLSSSGQAPAPAFACLSWALFPIPPSHSATQPGKFISGLAASYVAGGS